MEGFKTFLPENIYKKHLTCIENIKFTPREIDIIACILHGRSIKGISKFLSLSNKPISDRSIETHILNIRRKISGNSKESIVNFIEKSNKYEIIHNYYSSLLILKEFTEKLSQISTILQSQHPIVNIIYWITDEAPDEFIDTLNTYLQYSGIKTIIEERRTFDKFSLIPTNEHLKNNIIYIIPSQYTKKSDESIAYIKEIEATTTLQKSNVTFIFRHQTRMDVEAILDKYKYLYVFGKQSFYILFCNIFSKIFVDSNHIHEILNEFITQHKNIITIPDEIDYKNHFTTRQNHIDTKNSKINKYYYLFIGLLTFISLSNFVYNKYSTNQKTPSNSISEKPNL
jgi:DNA-binding CsgD family transcriptional regulator